MYNVNIVCASQLLASIIAICVRCIKALPLLSTCNQAQCRIVLGSRAYKDRLEHCILCGDLCSVGRASRLVQPCSATLGYCDTRSVVLVVHALQRSGPSLSSRFRGTDGSRFVRPSSDRFRGGKASRVSFHRRGNDARFAWGTNWICPPHHRRIWRSICRTWCKRTT